MAATNALLHQKRLQRLKRSGAEASVRLVSRLHGLPPGSPRRRDVEGEEQPLILEEERTAPVRAGYEITEITEMGRMAGMLFPRTGRNLFYLCLVIYLYGDLAIYGAAVAKSLRDVACSYRPANTTTSLNISESEPCWHGASQTRLDAYRIFLAVFTCTIGQFVFCNVTKTKYLQIFTTVMRWAAFLVMVVLACLTLAKGAPASPPPTRVAGLPNLFGVCVYSFMCHHSLPSLVTPIANKNRLYSILLGDYVLILGFYFLLAFTGIFAFRDLEDLYTLNFQPSTEDSSILYSLHMFLSLFPVFTLSTNFPIIGTTILHP